MTHYETDYDLDEETRIVKRIRKLPMSKVTFSLNFLWNKGNDWLSLVRIDNYPHKGKDKGVHIHRFRKADVQYKSMSIQEAEIAVVNIGKRIREQLRGLR